MTAAVRIFAHSGVVSVPIANRNLAASDEAFVVLTQPYLARESLTAGTEPVTSDAAAAPKGTSCLVVEVETGKTISFEVTPANADLRSADMDSPRLTGRNVIHFGPGYRLSVLEIAS
jgi:hypothetical protein